MQTVDRLTGKYSVYLPSIPGNHPLVAWQIGLHFYDWPLYMVVNQGRFVCFAGNSVPIRNIGLIRVGARVHNQNSAGGS
jgi:hypothetical protein